MGSRTSRRGLSGALIALLWGAQALAASPYEAVVPNCGSALPPFAPVTWGGEASIVFSGTAQWQTPDGPTPAGDTGTIAQTCGGFRYYRVVVFGSGAVNATANWDHARYPVPPDRLACDNGMDCRSDIECIRIGAGMCQTRTSCGHTHLDYGVYRGVELFGITVYSYVGGGGKQGRWVGGQCQHLTAPPAVFGHETWGTDTVSFQVPPSGSPLPPITQVVVSVQARSHGSRAVSCGQFACYPGSVLTVWK
jgi:hypothetical protein